MSVNDGLRKDLFQKQLENEDLRQRLQILEAVTGRDTSFISIMEDTTIDMTSYFGKNSTSKKVDDSSGLEAIDEESTPMPRGMALSSQRPPRAAGV